MLRGLGHAFFSQFGLVGHAASNKLGLSPSRKSLFHQNHYTPRSRQTPLYGDDSTEAHVAAWKEHENVTKDVAEFTQKSFKQLQSDIDLASDKIAQAAADAANRLRGRSAAPQAK